MVEGEGGLVECVMWLSLGQGAGCEIVRIPARCRPVPPNPPSLPRTDALRRGSPSAMFFKSELAFSVSVTLSGLSLATSLPPVASSLISGPKHTLAPVCASGLSLME